MVTGTMIDWFISDDDAIQNDMSVIRPVLERSQFITNITTTQVHETGLSFDFRIFIPDNPPVPNPRRSPEVTQSLIQFEEGEGVVAFLIRLPPVDADDYSHEEIVTLTENVVDEVSIDMPLDIKANPASFDMGMDIEDYDANEWWPHLHYNELTEYPGAYETRSFVRDVIQQYVKTVSE